MEEAYVAIPASLQDLVKYTPTHQTIKMSNADSHHLSTAMTVISTNIEGLTASKVSMLSELCLQDIHRAPHLARPKITGMTRITEPPHSKYGSAYQK